MDLNSEDCFNDSEESSVNGLVGIMKKVMIDSPGDESCLMRLASFQLETDDGTSWNINGGYVLNGRFCLNVSSYDLKSL